MPKTPNHGLWGSLAVAGLAAGAAVQTTRHNRKIAELERSDGFLQAILRDAIVHQLDVEWNATRNPKSASTVNLVSDQDVSIVEEMVTKAVEFGKNQFGTNRSPVMSKFIAWWAIFHSMEEIMRKHHDDYGNYTIGQCTAERDKFKRWIDLQTQQEAALQQHAKGAIAPREEGTSREDEDTPTT